MNRREFLTASLAVVATPTLAASKSFQLEREVGVVAATLAAHMHPRVPGGLKLNDLPRIIRQELDMRVIDMNTMNFAKLTPGVAESFRAAAERQRCVLTNLKLNQRNLDLGSEDTERRAHALKEYRQSIDAAALMGMRWVRPLPQARQGNRQHLIDGLRRLDDYAREKKIRVLIENFGWMQNEPDSVVNLIRDIDRELPASPDTGNWSHNEVRYSGLTKTFPLAATCDFKAKTLGPDGAHPAYDLKKCFRIGWDAGFRGPWCIEHGNRDVKRLYAELRLVKAMLVRWMREA